MPFEVDTSIEADEYWVLGDDRVVARETAHQAPGLLTVVAADGRRQLEMRLSSTDAGAALVGVTENAVVVCGHDLSDECIRFGQCSASQEPLLQWARIPSASCRFPRLANGGVYCIDSDTVRFFDDKAKVIQNWGMGDIGDNRTVQNLLILGDQPLVVTSDSVIPVAAEGAPVKFEAPIVKSARIVDRAIIVTLFPDDAEDPKSCVTSNVFLVNSNGELEGRWSTRRYVREIRSGFDADSLLLKTEWGATYEIVELLFEDARPTERLLHAHRRKHARSCVEGAPPAN